MDASKAGTAASGVSLIAFWDSCVAALGTGTAFWAYIRAARCRDVRNKPAGFTSLLRPSGQLLRSFAMA